MYNTCSQFSDCWVLTVYQTAVHNKCSKSMLEVKVYPDIPRYEHFSWFQCGELTPEVCPTIIDTLCIEQRLVKSSFNVNNFNVLHPVVHDVYMWKIKQLRSTASFTSLHLCILSTKMQSSEQSCALRLFYFSHINFNVAYVEYIKYKK
jgi:hypothetical protein